MDQQKPLEPDQQVNNKDSTVAPNSNPKEEVSRKQSRLKNRIETEGASTDLSRILTTDMNSAQDQIDIPEIKDWTQEQASNFN